MKRYRTRATTDLFCGLVGLSDTQATSRARNLRPVAEGVFEVVGPLQFKAGEVITLGDVDKNTLGRLECLDVKKAPAPADEQAPAVQQTKPKANRRKAK